LGVGRPHGCRGNPRSGFVSLDQVQAVVLENDGDWSVMPRSQVHDLTALVGLDLPAGVRSSALGDQRSD
jgi:hypothetical protein